MRITIDYIFEVSIAALISKLVDVVLTYKKMCRVRRTRFTSIIVASNRSSFLLPTIKHTKGAKPDVIYLGN